MQTPNEMTDSEENKVDKIYVMKTFLENNKSSVDANSRKCSKTKDKCCTNCTKSNEKNRHSKEENIESDDDDMIIERTRRAPFFNFLKECRYRYPKLTVKEILDNASETWSTLNPKQQEAYRDLDQKAMRDGRMGVRRRRHRKYSTTSSEDSSTTTTEASCQVHSKLRRKRCNQKLCNNCKAKTTNKKKINKKGPAKNATRCNTKKCCESCKRKI